MSLAASAPDPVGEVAVALDDVTPKAAVAGLAALHERPPETHPSRPGDNPAVVVATGERRVLLDEPRVPPQAA